MHRKMLLLHLERNRTPHSPHEKGRGLTTAAQ
jgi:hypothetical protein